ncbi:stage II sporulation protein R [Kroppenstedtia eburnea]|uniref:Stage II sporulation protein R n=1 Tax=Kroppenstedtia eburnea TaxID=714067 RepID=A0A1N7JLD4_9BACL|nr:stage II sporulation protein R [Kroppenstedtia eburnea]QKI83527.1 stage II sporulation protein R [Kroppenstedtia eburnea]SIS50115.1 stage II sporulation protein R [Kroppenstedtia eburnea]
MRVRTYMALFLLAVGFFAFNQWSDGGEDRGDSGGSVGAGSSEQREIPDEAIRLRILANSDSEGDQRVKRQVRDEVIREIGTWAQKPTTLKEARQLVRSRLPRLEGIAEQTLRDNGFSYPVKVRFGEVPFPTKLYGDKVYPAGKYEALLISIGEGKGDNWWCVLFPPLCFVDMSNGDALDEAERAVAAGQAMAAPAQVEKLNHPEEPQKAEIRFFLLDSLEDFFSGLFE